MMLPILELLTSVELHSNSFQGFQISIGASEALPPQRFRTQLPKEKEPGSYERINGRQ